MAKAPIEIRSLARKHTEEAINALLRIIRKPDASDSAVVSAASYMIDRGWGKPTTTIGGDADADAIRMIVTGVARAGD